MKKTFLAVLMIIALIAVSCSNESAGTTELEVRILDQSSRAIMPENQGLMNPASYRITLTLPDGSQKVVQSGEASTVITGIPIGVYTIVAESLDSEGKTIARGSEEYRLYKGHNSATVTLSELEGNGSMEVTVSWNPKSVEQNPIVELELFSQGGETVQIPSESILQNNTEGSTKLTIPSLPAGSYSLHARLKSDGYYVSGIVEAIRIARDQKSSGSLVFVIGNTSTVMNLGIQDNTSSPITGTITADPETVSNSEATQVTFTFTPGSLPSGISAGDITAEWFYEGESIGSGLVKTHTPLPGKTRYDVIVRHSKLGSMGSATIIYSMPYYTV